MILTMTITSILSHQAGALMRECIIAAIIPTALLPICLIHPVFQLLPVAYISSRRTIITMAIKIFSFCAADGKEGLAMSRIPYSAITVTVLLQMLQNKAAYFHFIQ